MLRIHGCWPRGFCFCIRVVAQYTDDDFAVEKLVEVTFAMNFWRPGALRLACMVGLRFLFIWSSSYKPWNRLRVLLLEVTYRAEIRDRLLKKKLSQTHRAQTVVFVATENVSQISYTTNSPKSPP